MIVEEFYMKLTVWSKVFSRLLNKDNCLIVKDIVNIFVNNIQSRVNGIILASGNTRK